MNARAGELLKRDPQHPVFYVHLKHQRQEEAQLEIHEGLEWGGVVGGVAAIRARRTQSGGPGAA
eukprot:1288855-Alexandrium_andersonii.AAC.1